MAELLGEGFVEIRPRLDAFKAELNKNARRAIKDNIETPAEQAEDAVNELISAAKRLGKIDVDLDVGDDVENAAKALLEATKQAQRLADVDIAENTERAVLEARLLERAQEAAKAAAEDVGESQDGVARAVAKATSETKKLIREIDSTADGAEEFEAAMLAAVRNIGRADTEAEDLASSIDDAATGADDLASNLTAVARRIPDDEADRFRDALTDDDIAANLRDASRQADKIADGVLDASDANQEFLERIRETKDEARQLQTRLDRVGDETDRIGDEARTAENRIEGATKETRQWEAASRGVRSVIAGIGAFLGAREIVQGLRSSTEAAIDFQGGLQEVFTLIPDADQIIRDNLTEGIREVSREFGQLPEDSIPALYNALSAGVPPDNVLAFLETASIVAVGGVTDLNTGVNVLTSAVNAYGAVLDENGNQVLDAGLAADILFTTVRLGKTTVDELNASLGQVLPTAAATGLSFEDVGAALAVLTANGLNTPRATTALNASLVELNKAGTRSFDLFERTAGQTFPDFISSGGNLAEGLRILAEGAEETGVSILDIVPVEAARGVLALTNNIDALDEVTAEFVDTAGAGQQALETIAEGDAFAVQQATAAFADLRIEIGNRLLPVVGEVARQFVDLYKGFLEGGVEGFIDRLSGIAPATAGIIERIIEFKDVLLDLFSELGAGDFFSNIFTEDFTIVDGIIASIAAGAALIGAAIIGFIGPVVAGAFGTVFAGLAAPITAAIGGLGAALGGIGGLFAGAFTGIGGIIGTVVSSFGALTTVVGNRGFLGTLRTLIPSISSIGNLLLNLVKFINPVALVVTLVGAAFVKLIATNEGFRQSLADLLPPLIAIGQSIVEQVVPVVEQLVDVFLNELIPAFEPVVEVIVAELLPAIIELVGSVVENLLPVFLDFVIFLGTEVLPVVAEVAAFLLTALVPAIATVITWVADNLIPAIVDLIGWFRDDLVPAIQGVVEWLGENLGPAFAAVGDFVTEDLVPALGDLVSWFEDNVLPAVVAVGEFFVSNLLPIFLGFVGFVITKVIPALVDLAGWFKDEVLPVLVDVAEFVGGTLGLIWEGFGLIITEIVVPALEAVWGFMSETLFPILTDVAGFIGGTFGLIWQGFSLIITEIVIPAFSAVWSFISDTLYPLLIEVAGFVGEVFGVGWQVLSTLFTDVVVPALQAVWAFMTDSLFPILETVASFVVDVFVAAWDGAVILFNDVLLPTLDLIWAFLNNTLFPVLETIATFVSGTLTAAWDGFQILLDGVVLPVLDAVWSFLEGSLNVALGALGTIVDGIKGSFDVLGPAIKDGATAPFRALWSLLKVLLAPVLILIDEGIFDLESGLGFLKTAIDLGKDAFNSFKNAIQRVIDTVGNLIDKVKNLKDLNPAGFLGDVAGGVAGFVGFAEGGIVTSATAAVIGEDGPEVVIPLGQSRRDRLFELARASGLDQLILNNAAQIEALPATPGDAEFQGLSRAVETTTINNVQNVSAPAPAMMTEPAQPAVRNFFIEASGVTIDEVITESEARADAALRTDEVGV